MEVLFCLQQRVVNLNKLLSTVIQWSIEQLLVNEIVVFATLRLSNMSGHYALITCSLEGVSIFIDCWCDVHCMVSVCSRTCDKQQGQV